MTRSGTPIGGLTSKVPMIKGNTPLALVLALVAFVSLSGLQAQPSLTRSPPAQRTQGGLEHLSDSAVTPDILKKKIG